MCGRFDRRQEEYEVIDRFDIQQSLFKVEPRFNIAPTQMLAVVTEHSPRTLEGMKWGLIPHFIRASVGGFINARAETLAEKPSFRMPLKHRRCLIPASGFYEWKKRPDGKQPMRICRTDGGLFAFAGLWEEWGQEDGEALRTCTIITVAPNALVAPIHNRMPAILQREDEALWLDRSVTDPAAVLPLLRPYPDDELTAYPVSTRVNRAEEDCPECLLPLAHLAATHH
jgi:putative SOS response-associated peptidase YedK